MGAHEKTGRLPLYYACEEFRLAIDDCRLQEIDTRGAFYTWANGQGTRGYVECCLDRSFSSSACLAYWDSVSCAALPRHHSDNNLFPLNCAFNMATGPCPFIFRSM